MVNFLSWEIMQKESERKKLATRFFDILLRIARDVRFERERVGRKNKATKATATTEEERKKMSGHPKNRDTKVFLWKEARSREKITLQFYESLFF